MPLANAAALFGMLAIVLMACLAVSALCGFIALAGVKQHGREGILLPAAIGLLLSALMLAPMLYGLGYGASSRVMRVLARERQPVTTPLRTETGPAESAPAPAPLKPASVSVPKSDNFIPAEKRTDLVHDSARNHLYITAGNEVLRYDLSAKKFLPPFELGGNLCGMDLSPDGQTLAVADRSRAADKVWVHLVDLASGTNSRALFNAAFMEGGTYSVAFGADEALYTTSTFEGSGRVPFRRYGLATGRDRVLQQINQNTMLSATPDRRRIAYAEANNSSGPFGVYDCVKKAFVLTSQTARFNWEVAISRDGELVAVPTYVATTIAGDSPQSIGGGTEGAPVAAAFHPTRDVVFFPWVRTAEVRAYDTRTWKLLERIDFSDTFDNTGNHAFVNGRLRTSQDGTWLFCTVKGGVRYVRPKLIKDVATVDRR